MWLPPLTACARVRTQMTSSTNTTGALLRERNTIASSTSAVRTPAHGGPPVDGDTQRSCLSPHWRLDLLSLLALPPLQIDEVLSNAYQVSSSLLDQRKLFDNVTDKLVQVRARVALGWRRFVVTSRAAHNAMVTSCWMVVVGTHWSSACRWAPSSPWSTAC